MDEGNQPAHSPSAAAGPAPGEAAAAAVLESPVPSRLEVNVDVDGVVELPASLSPSRAADFMTCPLLYRFRVVDRLPEPPSAAATRGTLVHSVLEQLFDLPASERTVDAAESLVAPSWAALLEAEPELAALVDGDGAPGTTDFLAAARPLLEAYFALEDPTRLEPAQREVLVEARVSEDLVVRGYVDRLDVAPTGATRVVDYKTGRAPRDGFEQKAMFQMRFYALVLWRSTGSVPRRLELLYLGSGGERLHYEPDEADLLATERKIVALWSAIRGAAERGDWRSRRSRLCDWCSHQSLCPEFGGTPPPLPTVVIRPYEPGERRSAGPSSTPEPVSTPEEIQ
jgi:putative RecB family exonuclease